MAIFTDILESIKDRHLVSMVIIWSILHTARYLIMVRDMM